MIALSYPHNTIDAISMLIITLVFLTSGITHFTHTAFYVSIMPPLIPWPLFWVYITAVIELLLLCGFWIADTRYYCALGLILFSILVFPANIYMALYPDRFSQYSLTTLYARLPLQFVLIYVCWLARGPSPH